MAAKRLISRAPATVILSLLLICMGGGEYIFPAAEAIWMTIPSAGSKCVSEEIQNNVIVLAHYYTVDNNHNADDPTLNVRVTSPLGNEVYSAQNVSGGQIAFTASETGSYIACFNVVAGRQKNHVVLGLDWKIGIAAKDWDSIAKKEKLKGVELHMRKLKEVVGAIRGNLLYISYREASMRRMNEETNRRVSQLSIMYLALCVVVSVLQAWHLKRFFQKNKLI